MNESGRSSGSKFNRRDLLKLGGLIAATLGISKFAGFAIRNKESLFGYPCDK